MRAGSALNRMYTYIGGPGPQPTALQTHTQTRARVSGAGLYNVDGFFDPLIQFFGHAVSEGFISKGNVDNLVISSDAADLVDRLAGWAPVVRGLILTSEERKAAIGADVSEHVAGQ